MNENEWKREDEIEIGEEMHTTRYLKHLRPLQRGLLLRCWSLLQASCLLGANLCFRLRLAPRAIIIIFITIICLCLPFTLEWWVIQCVDELA